MFVWPKRSRWKNLVFFSKTCLATFQRIKQTVLFILFIIFFFWSSYDPKGLEEKIWSSFQKLVWQLFNELSKLCCLFCLFIYFFWSSYDPKGLDEKNLVFFSKTCLATFQRIKQLFLVMWNHGYIPSSQAKPPIRIKHVTS